MFVSNRRILSRFSDGCFEKKFSLRITAVYSSKHYQFFIITTLASEKIKVIQFKNVKVFDLLKKFTLH